MTRIEFVCTNRRQHRPVELGHIPAGTTSAAIFSRVARNEPKKPFWDEAGKYIGGLAPGTYAARKVHGQTMMRRYVTTWGEDPLRPDGTEFLCPKCGRNPQKKQDWIKTFVAGIRAARIAEVDISLYLD